MKKPIPLRFRKRAGWLAIAALALLAADPALARQKRSTVERHAFVRENACPATGRHRLRFQKGTEHPGSRAGALARRGLARGPAKLN
jgi:hypothetical protein